MWHAALLRHKMGTGADAINGDIVLVIPCDCARHEYRCARLRRLASQGHPPQSRIGGLTRGEMAEWSKAHAWKVCRRVTVSRVRIPLSPPLPQRATKIVIFEGNPVQRLDATPHDGVAKCSGVSPYSCLEDVMLGIAIGRHMAGEYR